MRNCPVCEYHERDFIFSMTYRAPGGWTVPSQINWYVCGRCQMIYGDGEFTQIDLDQYYRERYGFGVNSPANVERLKRDAEWVAENFRKVDTIIDFGGAGDDGRSILVDALESKGFLNAYCLGVGDELYHHCQLIYASHVLEHIHDLPGTMEQISGALAPDGLLIIDVPDSTGLLQHWKMPILDYNTKHLNHFTLRTLLELGRHYGFESVCVKPYELDGAPALQVHFRRLDVAVQSMLHINDGISRKIRKLQEITEPVNIWGLGDITWHLLSLVNPDVLDYIDSDPAMRGQTYNGKPIQARPTNDKPIVIMSQGQRGRLIEYIHSLGLPNKIIEI